MLQKHVPNFKDIFYLVKMETSHMNINLEILPFENVFYLQHKFLIMLFNKNVFVYNTSIVSFSKSYYRFTWKFEIFLEFLNIFSIIHKLLMQSIAAEISNNFFSKMFLLISVINKKYLTRKESISARREKILAIIN